MEPSKESPLSNTSCEHEDGCVRIRLTCGDANALTTAVIRDLSRALDAADGDARGVMLCGGEKFFSNGVDLDWALTQSRAEIREMFFELAGSSWPCWNRRGRSSAPSRATPSAAPWRSSWPATIATRLKAAC